MKRVVLTGLAALVLLLAASGSASVYAAGVRTWTGNGASNNWSDAGNWDTGVPGAGDSLVFPQSANRKSNSNDLGPTTFNNVTLNGAGYTIGGAGFAVSGTLANQPASGTNEIDAAIGGGGSVSQNGGTLALTAPNTYSGGTNVQSGLMVVTDDDALGSGAVTVSAGATLRLSGGIDVGAVPVLLAGDGFDDKGALQSSNGSNAAANVSLDGAVTVGVFSNVLTISNGLDQAGPGASLTLVGGGKLEVDGSGSFNGAISAVAGNLTWNSFTNGGATVARDGLLRGTGTVGGISVTAGAVWPGSGAFPGTLTSTGGTTFVSGFFKVDLDGPSAGEFGKLQTGSLALNPAATLLDVELGFAPSLGQVFTIIDNAGGPVAGTFTSLPEGAVFGAGGYAFQISYHGGDGNDVTLKALRQVSADLGVTLTASPSPVGPGELLYYMATVTNAGPDAASTPRLTMGTPSGTTYQSATGPDGWTCSKPSSSPSVNCVGPTLASGSSATITLVFKVNAGLSSPIVGTAGVNSPTNDPASANNSDTVTTSVGAGGGKPFRLFVPMVAREP